MNGSTVIAFLALDLLLVLTPGADWAYTITAALGERSLPAAISGLVAGYAGYTFLVMTGLAVLVARTPGVLTGLTVIGAAYLIWLGASTLARPSAPELADQVQTTTRPGLSRWRDAAKGAAVSGLNPKGLLLYLALLPQFTRAGAGWPVAAQIGLLGVLHMTDCAVAYSAVGSVARVLLQARAAAARRFSRVSGAVMVVVGAALLTERLVEAGIPR